MKFTTADQGSTAEFSNCGRYRYSLGRAWAYPVVEQPYVLFVLLNPSTADHSTDDPTIRRCIQFTRHWGFTRLVVCNLFAFRATDPAVMLADPDPIGPENDLYLQEMIAGAYKTVAAWGNHGNHLNRAADVLDMIPEPFCLGVNKTGQPKHPLYLSTYTELKPLNNID